MENITGDIRYIGVNDYEIDLFEGMYDVPEGMAYNSYVILDDRIAVMDTTATSLAMDNDLPVIVFALADPENIFRVLQGEAIGTFVN